MIDFNSSESENPEGRENCPDFEGLSPAQMHNLLYTPFDHIRSPFTFNTNVPSELIEVAPIYKHIVQYLALIKSREPIKLTQTGSLPRDLCRALCDAGIFEDERNRRWFTSHPITKEMDSGLIHFLHLFSHTAGLTRKRRGKINVTNNGRRYLLGEKPGDFYQYLFEIFTQRANWEYYDNYPESWIIQSGFGFSLLLLRKYGCVLRESGFYSEKYLRAFPMALRDFPRTNYFEPSEMFNCCYYLRVFIRFLQRFGLVDILKERKMYAPPPQVQKTELADHIIKWKIEE